MFLFGDMVLDAGRRELRSGQTVVSIEPQVFDILEFLIRNQDRVVSKDQLLAAVWDGRIVSDSAIAARINAARRAIGDSGEQQRWIRTIPRKGFRFVGDVREEEESGTQIPPAEPAAEQVPDRAPRGEAITFCRTKDGVNLAVGCIGEGMPLVSIPTWISHLELEWQSPTRGPLWRFLADRYRLVRYDGRGLGLSDRDIGEVSFVTFEQDLETVVDALGLRRYALLGISQGASTAIAHAVRHPERVTKMVLHGGFALGRNRRASEKDAELGKAFMAIMREGWGDEDSALLRIFSSAWYPGASPEQIKWFAHYQRISTSAETAIKLRSACDDIDIVDLLPKVTTPTLVLHCLRDNVVPFDEGRRIAASIPNAKLVSLDSENHNPTPGHPAWPRCLEAMENFLSEPDAVSRPSSVVRLARP